MLSMYLVLIIDTVFVKTWDVYHLLYKRFLYPIHIRLNLKEVGADVAFPKPYDTVAIIMILQKIWHPP